MRNKLGIYHLFGENIKSKRLFYDWCKSSDEFCDYDLEHLEIDLFMSTIDNIDKYFHFHRGNILDWLEEKGYYIGTPLRGEFKFVTVLHLKKGASVHQKPLYSNSGVKSRQRALELGVINAIKHLEKSENI